LSHDRNRRTSRVRECASTMTAFSLQIHNVVKEGVDYGYR
jgi:hypothetical protein